MLESEEDRLQLDRVQDLRSSIAALQAENELLEGFISRLDPLDLLGQTGRAAGGAGSQLDTGGLGWRRRSRPSISDRLQQLSSDQKLFVAQREVTETRHDLENLKREHERTQDSYKASLKESQLRLAEVRKARTEFERRVVKPLRVNRVEVKEPEKLLLLMVDKMKITQLEKFGLKNQALRAEEKKLQQQLQRQRELGKAEYEEVFPEFTEQRSEKSREELQVDSLKAQRVLSSVKEKLQTVTRESRELSDDIINRKQMLEKMEEEIQHAEEERLKAEALNKHLRRQRSDYRAPDVSEYMSAKDKHKKLRRSVHRQRKVGLAEMTFRRDPGVWSELGAAVTPVSSAVAAALNFEEEPVPVKLPHIR